MADWRNWLQAAIKPAPGADPDPLSTYIRPDQNASRDPLNFGQIYQDFRAETDPMVARGDYAGAAGASTRRGVQAIGEVAGKVAAPVADFFGRFGQGLMSQSAPTPSPAPSGGPSLNSAMMAFNPAEGGRVVDGLRGLTQAQPRQVTNPNPSGRNGQVPIGALLELAKVMPKPKQQSFGEQLVGMQFARLQQQLAAAKDPKMIEEISKRMDSLAIAGNRGNPMNYSLSSLLGQGNE
jgi:hypothetical protein